MISIHVPAWGTTLNNPYRQQWLNDFNPRSRVGNDNFSKMDSYRHHKISIHVPAWGTTSDVLTRTFTKSISIHVPAWGTTLCL